MEMQTGLIFKWSALSYSSVVCVNYIMCDKLGKLLDKHVYWGNIFHIEEKEFALSINKVIYLLWQLPGGDVTSTDIHESWHDEKADSGAMNAFNSGNTYGRSW